MSGNSSVSESETIEIELSTSAGTEAGEITEEITKNLPIIFDGKFFKINSLEKCGKVKATCQLCRPKSNIISGTIQATTNFKTHIKRRHENSLQEFDKYVADRRFKLKRKLNSAEGAADKKKDAPTAKKLRQTLLYDKNMKQKQFDQNIVRFITAGMKPLSTVEDENFRKIVADLDANINVMSRRTLGRKILQEHLVVKNKLKETLQKIKYISTTADIWSTKHRSFMGVTAHWIDEITFKRVGAVLSIGRFFGTHSYDKIAEMLCDIHAEYAKRDQIVSTVTDNGSNFVKAFKEFGITLPLIEDDVDVTDEDTCEAEVEIIASESEELEFHSIEAEDAGLLPNFILPRHLRCAAHTLSLIATTDFSNAIKNSPVSRIHYPTFAKCTSLWNLSRRPKSAEVICEMLGCNLQYPCATRWNSLYDCAAQLVTFKDKLNAVFQKLNKNISFKEL